MGIFLSTYQLINLHQIIKMKLLLAFLAVLFVAFASGCEKDYECADGCCIGVGKLKGCLKYLKYGEKCTTRKKMGVRCICRPGLECVKVGIWTHKCKTPKPTPKPKTNVQHCKQDYECPGGCCIGVGELKYCLNYLKVNEKCTIRSGMGVRCVCEPGLSCVKTGLFTKRCKAI